MYDRAAISAVETQVIADANLDMDPRYGPWLNPPFFAWFFVPLAALPYRQAALIFLVLNTALLIISLKLLTQMVVARSPGESFAGAASRKDWRTLALVPFLTLLPLPVLQAMGHQQNTFISLFLLIVAVTCWRQGKAFSAGAVAGLLFFKPQLAALFAGVMAVALGWRAIAGLCVTGAALLCVTLVTMPGSLGDFFHQLPPILHWLQMESPYNWARQVTPQSFWRILIQGHVRGETSAPVEALWWLTSGAIGMAMISAVRRSLRGPQSQTARDRLIAAAVVSMPLLMPYYMDYDLLLLAVPAVLFAAEWVREPDGITRSDHWLLYAWIAYGLESHFNPGLAGDSRFNLTAPLLAAIAGLHLWRCVRPRIQLTQPPHATNITQLNRPAFSRPMDQGFVRPATTDVPWCMEAPGQLVSAAVDGPSPCLAPSSR
ncbi:MAG TPA: glycosyltransferase family 87 protein [Tepidisphaeraceae bacterium]|nr:glycosyltransferase family 87 protein [Tepidisphaeraceae bacterium]